MNKLTKSRLLSFLLAMVMIIGTISPAFAAGLEDPFQPEPSVETELIARDGKLRGRLVVPRNVQVQTRSAGLFRAPAKTPAFGETTVKVNIVKHGIGTAEFNFDAVFGNTPDTKVTFINWDTDVTQQVSINKDTQNVTFDDPVLMDDIKEGVYGIEFEGTNVAGKITYEESAPSYDGKTYITTYTLDLYQIRNTDVVVTTKTADGTVVTNPTTKATKGQIKLTAGTVTETIDIPTGTDATETVKNFNTRNKDDINSGLNFSIEGTKNGVLVDNTANKVYKPEVEVDPDGLKPTEITFTEKIVADTVTENGGLDPVTIKVWKNDDIDWDKGVAPKTTNTDARELVKQLLDNAEVTDLSSRNSANSGKFEGKLQVKFGDGSTLEVENQWLYVWEHIVTVDPTDPDSPKEEDLPTKNRVKVLFEAIPNRGVESITTKGTTYAKNGTVFQDIDFPQVTFKEGYKGPVTWTPASHTVSTDSRKGYDKRRSAFVFNAKAEKNTKADQVTKLGGLKAKDIAVWVGDQITWANGVEANDAAKKAEVEALLAGARVEDQSNRSSDKKGEYKGNLLVTFDDTSTIEVKDQMLYVYENGDEKPDGKPVPTDAATVTFTKDDNSIKADGWDTVKPIIVKKGTKVPEGKFPNAEAKEGYKSVTWTPAKDTVVNDDQAFNAKATLDTNFDKTNIVEITFVKDPDKMSYTEGDPLNQDGLKIKLKDKNGNEVTIGKDKLNEYGVTVTPNDGTNLTINDHNGKNLIASVNDKDGKTITANSPGTLTVTKKVEGKPSVTYPDTEVEKGKTETVTPKVTDNDGKPVPENKVGTPTVTNTNDLPEGVTVTPKDNGKVDITVPDGYDGPKDFTVKVTVQVDGKDVESEIKVIVKDKTTPPTPSYNYLTLTLDENYRGGEITQHEVLEGDLIERYLYTPRRRGYVFEGWSYNSRRLDEVKPGDRIYYPTTLYAIWAKDRDYDRDEREEEPEDLRPVHDHNAYMFGYTDGTVRPNGKITRAEAAALVTRLLGLDTFASAAKPMFSDTPSSWYNKAINAAVQRGIMKGYPDGRFRPNAPITRAEFTQMISTIDNKPYGVAPFADVKGHWAERPIGSEYQAGRIMGYPDQTFRPNAFITRCEAVVILNKMFERNYDAMSLKDAKNAYLIKGFIDLPTSFWGYYDMIEATNSHSFKRRVQGKVQEDWTLVK